MIPLSKIRCRIAENSRHEFEIVPGRHGAIGVVCKHCLLHIPRDEWSSWHRTLRSIPVRHPAPGTQGRPVFDPRRRFSDEEAPDGNEQGTPEAPPFED